MRLSNNLRILDALAVILAASMVAAGCASRRAIESSWRSVNIHRVVVVCIQGDKVCERRREAALVPVLRHQGLDAISARDFFSDESKYSARELFDQMARAHVDGIMKVVFDQQNLSDVKPAPSRLRYYSLRKDRRTLPNGQSSLESAFLLLIRD